MKRQVVLMSDFGTRDGAAAVMEGVVKRINPEADVIHLTHEVEGFNVKEGAFLLLANYWHFVPETIFVAVVDPEVGTGRSIVFAQGKNYSFIGPDNGILWPVIEAEKIGRIFKINGDILRQQAAIEKKSTYFDRPASSAFEGRDYMSVAAGRLSEFNFSAHGSFSESMAIHFKEGFLNISKTSLRKLTLSLKKKGEDLAEGDVVFIDNYGNLVVSCTREKLLSFLAMRNYSISIKDQKISHISKTYDEGKEGELIAIFGGDFEHPVEGSFLEIAINQGNAAEVLDVKAGDKVIIERK